MAKQSDFVNNNQRAIFLLFTTIFLWLFGGSGFADAMRLNNQAYVERISLQRLLVYFHNKMRDLYSHHKLEGGNFSGYSRRKSIPSQRLFELIHFCALVNSPSTLQDCGQTFYEIQIRAQISSLCKTSDWLGDFYLCKFV